MKIFQIFILPFCFTIPPKLVINKNVKSKNRGTLIPFKIWKGKFDRLYFRDKPAYACEQNFSKASGSVFWSSEQTFPKTSIFFKNNQWHLVYWFGFCGQTSQSKQWSLFSLIAVNVFSRFVRVELMRTKYAKDIVQAIRKLFLEKMLLTIFGLIKTKFQNWI